VLFKVAVHEKNSLTLQGLQDTTKARDGLQRVPLMLGIGDAVFVNDISYNEIRSAATVLLTIASHTQHQGSNIVTAPAAPALVL